MSEIHIEEIYTSDNIKQFMDKCNDNFSSIQANGGGPQGRPGVDGETGATGKRGNKIHWVEVPDDIETFDIETANTLILSIDDIEDGDIALFSNGYMGNIISIQSEDSSEYIPTINEIKSLRGRQGVPGEQGDASSPQFEAREDSLLMQPSFEHLILPRYEDGDLISTPTSTLCIVNGGVGFVSEGMEQSTIKSDENELKFKISSNLDISLSTRENISIGDFGIGTAARSVSIVGGTIDISSSGSNNKITIGQNDVKVFGKSIFDDDIETSGKVKATGIVSSTQKLSAPVVETQSVSVTNLNGIGFVKIDNADGFNIGNALKVRPNNSKDIVITSFIDSSKQIKANNGNNKVYLGTPMYTLMLYPRYANIPSHWVDFNDAIIITNVQERTQRWGADDSENINPPGNAIYFKYNTPDGMKNCKITSLNTNIGKLTYSVASAVIPTGTTTTGTTTPGGVTAGSGATVGGNSVIIDDVEFDIDDGIIDDDTPIAPIVPDSGPNVYANFIKHILTSTTGVKDMSSMFVRLVLGSSVSYILPVPTKPSNAFMWIFKTE